MDFTEGWLTACLRKMSLTHLKRLKAIDELDRDSWCGKLVGDDAHRSVIAVVAIGFDVEVKQGALDRAASDRIVEQRQSLEEEPNSARCQGIRVVGAPVRYTIQ